MSVSGSGGSVSGSGGAAGSGGGGGLILQVGGSGSRPTDPNADTDGDGYIGADDCDDADPSSNPGAFDVPGNQVDEDCSGKADDEPKGCDAALPLDGDAMAAAKGLGLCRVATAGTSGKQKTWGVVAARYVFPDGAENSDLTGPYLEGCDSPKAPHPMAHGVLPSFGQNVAPRDGERFTALSSGIAREGVNEHPTTLWPSPFAARMCSRARAPQGFPASTVESCGDVFEPVPEDGVFWINDAIALELVIRAPTNAKSFSFDFTFYTYEYSQFVCSAYNDAFVTLLYSKSADVPANHNISFDSLGNAVTVNNGFVEVCEPYTYLGLRNGMEFSRYFSCNQGTSALLGTGFDAINGDTTIKSFHAATGWLRTQANIVPGEELTLRFAIWDAGDASLDSTVLLDSFTWGADPGKNTTVRPPN